MDAITLRIGDHVEVNADILYAYRAQGKTSHGEITGVLPSGGIARVQFGSLDLHYIRLDDLHQDHDVAHFPTTAPLI